MKFKNCFLQNLWVILDRLQPQATCRNSNCIIAYRCFHLSASNIHLLSPSYTTDQRTYLQIDHSQWLIGKYVFVVYSIEKLQGIFQFLVHIFTRQFPAFYEFSFIYAFLMRNQLEWIAAYLMGISYT